MPLGSSALPPEGYVAFCERKPQDCGADAASVVARALRADADRRELLALIGTPQQPALTPAALGVSPTSASGLTRSTPLASAERSADARLAPPPEVQEVSVEAARIETSAAFIDPAAEAAEEADERAPRMTPKLWSLLNRVNGEINGEIQQRTDMANYGVEDYWNTPLEDGRRAGDCEDYVLEKQRALIAAGVPRRAINIAVVTTRWGEGHAVLLVATSEGEYVLDSLSPWLLTWRQAPYRWQRREVNGDAFNWVMIRDPAATRDLGAKGLLIASNR